MKTLENPWLISIVSGIIATIIGGIILVAISRFIYYGGPGLFLTLAALSFFACISLILFSVPSGNPHDFDITRFFLGVIPIVGSLLTPWHKGAAVTLLMLPAVLLILIGYFTTEINMVATGILLHITAILAAARESRVV